MDLGLLARVIWRFKWIAMLGFIVSVLLAVLSTASISSTGVKYRSPIIYSAQTRVLVTQSGFPWGRTVFPSLPTDAPASALAKAPGYADPTRFAALATIYAQLVNGDEIQRQVVHPRLKQLMVENVEIDHTSNNALPFVDVTAFAPSPLGAARLAQAGTDALRSFVAAQQVQARIPTQQRVLLQVLQHPRITVAQPRKKTVPIVVFVAVMLATLGALLALENLRPRASALAVSQVTLPQAEDLAVQASRRTA